jgi:thiamine-monophosphate kinase
MSDERKVAGDVGEFGLIDRFLSRIPAAPPGEVWSGDDAAVVPARGRTVVTTDVLVDGVDFDFGHGTPADAGWKAIAANVSDIAAMGGQPSYCVAALTLPVDTPLATIDRLLDGMLEGAARWDVALVGGDVSEGKQLSLAITCFGSVDDPVLRSGARPGNSICVTGSLGGAAGGLLALRSGRSGAPIDALIRRQLRPEARVDEGRRLAGVATALIDVSDGLLADLGHLLDASRVGCDIDLDAIPVDPNLTGADLGADPLDLALTGGEDFELLAAIPEERFGEMEALVTRIGVITESGREAGGRSLDEWKDKGWEHLRG